MKVKEIMTRDVCLARPDQTLCDAAREMERLDVGVLPVAEGDRLVGMITDRDIAVRGIAHGFGPSDFVRDVMSPEIKYCFEEHELDELASNMADQQIRRLPVLNEQKRLVGIVSLGDVAGCREANVKAVALTGISQTGGLHNQTLTALG